MNFRISKNLHISRGSLAVALLYGSTLIWFYLFHGYLFEQILPSGEKSVFILGKFIFYGSIVIFGIIGSLISERLERRKFLAIWIAFGLLNTISLSIFRGLEIILVQSLFLGISFGLGFPSCQFLLAKYAEKWNRGRFSGKVVSVSFLFLVLILVMSEPNALNFGLTELIWVSVVLKLIGFIALLIDPFDIKLKKRRRSFMSVLSSKDFIAYLVPWLIFQICNGIVLFMELPFDPTAVERVAFVLEFLGVLIAALVSGYLADYVGRRIPILVGLLFLGSSYALLGLVTTELSWLLVNVSGGVAWGLITVSYMQVVLGDMATKETKENFGSGEKFFALGGIAIPIFIYTLFSVARANWSEISFSGSVLSSILSVILFISVIPIWNAKDTLGTEEKEKIKLKEHIEKVGRIVKEDKSTKD